MASHTEQNHQFPLEESQLSTEFVGKEVFETAALVADIAKKKALRVIEEVRVRETPILRKGRRLPSDSSDPTHYIYKEISVDMSDLSDLEKYRLKNILDSGKSKETPVFDGIADSILAHVEEPKTEYVEPEVLHTGDEMSPRSERKRVDEAWSFVMENILALGICPDNLLQQVREKAPSSSIKLVNELPNGARAAAAPEFRSSEGGNTSMLLAIENMNSGVDEFYFAFEEAIEAHNSHEGSAKVDIKKLLTEADLRLAYLVSLVAHEYTHLMINFFTRANRQVWLDFKEKLNKDPVHKFVVAMSESEKTVVEELMTMSVERHLTFAWALQIIVNKANLAPVDSANLAKEVVKKVSRLASQSQLETLKVQVADLSVEDIVEVRKVSDYLTSQSDEFTLVKNELVYFLRHLPIQEVKSLFNTVA